MISILFSVLCFFYKLNTKAWKCIFPTHVITHVFAVRRQGGYTISLLIVGSLYYKK